MTLVRSHLYLPIIVEDGSLLTYVKVTVINSATGQPSTQDFYPSDDPSESPLPKPLTFTPGVVELWCAEPERVNIQVIGPNGWSTTIYGLDLQPAGDQVAIVAAGHPNPPIQGTPRQGYIPRGNPPVWSAMNLIAPHQHDGSQTGSTSLIPEDPPADLQINESLIGNGTDQAVGSVQTSSSALGQGAQPKGAQTLAAGYQAAGVTSGGQNPDRATALGSGAHAAQDAVNLRSTRTSTLKSVNLPLDSDAVSRNATDPTLTYWRYFKVAATAVEIGSTIPTPAVPSGVTSPFWFKANFATSATFKTSARTALAGSANKVGFYGSAGATRIAAPTGATGALASLINALKAYGLLS